MTGRQRAPLMTTPFALLLAATGVALLAGWPSRTIDGNDAWFLVATVRTAGLAAWAWFAGLQAGNHANAGEGRTLVQLTFAAVVTMPIEMTAHAGSAATTPMAWSLIYAPLLALSAFIVSHAWTRWLHRAAPAVRWLLSLALLLVIGALDLRFGPPITLAWVAPSTPNVAAVAVHATVIGVFLVTRFVPRWVRRRDAA